MPEFDSTIVYRDVPGFPGYKAGSDGTVWSEWKKGGARRRCGVWREVAHAHHTKGYRFLCLSRNGKQHGRTVHRVILETFVGPRPAGRQARHLNGVPDDNRLANLCWGTQSENEADKVACGTAQRGERNGAAKLTWAKVDEIRRLLAEGYTQASVARRMGVCQPVICSINKGKTWGRK